ncbi:MAG: Hsp20/alpha crystallin family protein [Acidobacteria bacterium]|nr:Hsp20/alpha crystallin family protein [Acidobacteriota bacterium]MCA1641868.1 Hsp20/alpha crystallin family protein [Acidobacteriota bacterium]
MARSIERYMRLMPVGGRQQRPSERRWSPAADVYRIKEGWLVKVDLAGVSPEEVEITVAGRVLAIEGSRRDAFCEETLSYHQLEITYSRFEKTLRFPCAIDGARIERDYRDGFLLIFLHSNEQDCDDASSQPSALSPQPEE